MNLKMEIRPGRIINIFVHKNPEQQTAVFLIHGLGGNSKQWRKQLAFFQDKYTVIIPDLLGHGDSEKPKPQANNPYDFLELKQDLQIIFEKFADHRNIMMGHSYGGALATCLAFANQSRIQKLILIAPIPCQPSEETPLLYHLPAWMLECLRPSLETNFKEAAFDKATANELISDEARESKHNRMYVIKAMRLGMKNVPLLNLQQLQTPAIILCGETDNIISVPLVQEFYEKIPQQQFFLIEHAAHLVMLEQPVEVNQMIENFLESDTLS